MLSWFKHTTTPLFWKTYLNKFKTVYSKQIKSTTFIVFDTETTGLNIKTDKILSIGAVTIFNNTINISKCFECYLKQEDFNSETVKIHGLLKEGNLIKLQESKAIEEFLNFIGNSVLVAHHAAFDIAMVNEALKRMKLPKLKNKFIDTGILYKKLEGKKDEHFNLDVLSDEFKIPKHDRHTASGDAYITAILFLKIISRLKQQRNLHYSDLFRNTNKKGLL
jgi:DNA polymerase-3 subunit epsilon